MKKYLLLLTTAFFLVLSGIGQTYQLSVTGTVYDLGGNTIAPVPDQEVTIVVDSTFSGFYYENTVMTDSAGIFSDLIDFGNSMPMGLVHIYTFDPCLGINQEQIFHVGQGMQSVVTEFYLCDTVVDPCQAAFYYYHDSMGMMNKTFQFVDISTGNPTSWFWDFGDGTHSTEQNPVHVFPDDGIFPVCLTITDSSNNCSSTYCEDVFVGPGGPGGCHNFFTFYPTGEELEFTFEGFLMCGDTAESYTWDFGDGTTGTGQTVTHTFPGDSTQTFVVCLTTTVLTMNGDTCVSTSCKDVPMMPPPFPCSNFFTFEPVDSLTFDFHGEAFMGGMVVTNNSEFYWDFGDGTTDTGQSVTHTFPGDSVNFYHVCLTTYSVDPQTGDTCNSYFCHMVHLNTWPGNNCVSNFMHYPETGLVVNFEGFTMSTYPTDYTWEFGDGETGTGPLVSHEYDSAGVYTVTLTTLDSTGCGWTRVKDIMVGTSDFNIFGTVFVDSALTADVGMVRLVKTDSLWQSVEVIDSVDIQPDGTYLFENVPMGFHSHYYTQAELGAGSAYYGDYLPTYHIHSLTWENAFPIMPFMNWPADIFMIPGNTVNTGPATISGSVTSLGARDVMEGVHVMLMSEAHSPYTYVKTSADGTFDFSDIALGTYIVRAEIMGVHNTETTITLTEETQVANVNFIIDGNQAFLSVKEPGFVNLGSVGDIYPNPVTEQASIQIVMKERTGLTITIHDLTGNTIWSDTEEFSQGNHEWKIRTENLSNGIYFLKVSTENGEQVTRKLIKAN